MDGAGLWNEVIFFFKEDKMSHACSACFCACVMMKCFIVESN